MPDIQPVLFASEAYGNPIARESDPAPSHEAAAKINASGKRHRHADIVLGIVRRHPEGSTYTELFEYSTPGEKAELKDKYEVMRRLNDLAKASAVIKGDVRLCLVQGSPMTTWKLGKENHNG